MAELEDFVEQEWDNITPADIKAAVNHVWKLSRVVIEHNSDFVPDYIYRRVARNN